MVQLAINSTALPKLEKGYKCYLETKRENARMANGRLVTDKGYSYVVIEAGPYGYMENSFKNEILTYLRSGSALAVAYLSDDSNELQAASFKCTKLTPPTYAFSKGDTSYWTGMSFVLEGVNAVD